MKPMESSPSAVGQYGTLLPPERHAVSNLQAGMALFKSIMGPGILFLPAGVKNAGLLSAVCVSAVAGLLSTWCLLLVLDTAQTLRRHGHTMRAMSDIGRCLFGASGKAVVDTCVVLSQLGFCVAYCVFVAENVQAMLFEVQGGMVAPESLQRSCNLTGLLANEALVYYVILFLIPFIIPVTWLRQMKYFAVTNTIASGLVVVSVVYMLIILGIRLAHTGHAGGLTICNWHETLIYTGTALYAFEGVAVVLPIEDKMAEPERMPQVVCWTLLLICSMQILFACVAYLNYGSATQSIVTISLAQGHVLGGIVSVILVQLCWVIAVLLTFPLQIFPVVRLLEAACSFQERHSGQKWLKNLLRTGLVLLCMLVSLLGYTSVDNMISMIGALGCIPLGITYPAWFHYTTKRHYGGDQKCDTLGAIGDLVMTGLGMFCTVAATALAVMSWLETDFHFQSCVLRS